MSRKKLTAADRPDFRREMGKMIAKHDIQPAEITPEVMILCSRAEDFDPETNVLWELHGNKSEVRPGVLCVECKRAVAMSHDAFAKYSAFDKKPRVCCLQCAVRSLEQ